VEDERVMNGSPEQLRTSILPEGQTRRVVKVVLQGLDMQGVPLPLAFFPLLTSEAFQASKRNDTQREHSLSNHFRREDSR
jgi:hypothetical protein